MLRIGTDDAEDNDNDKFTQTKEEDETMYPTIKDVAAVLISKKVHIEDHMIDGEESTVPGVDITLGWTSEDNSWAVQTGDNSLSGFAYGHPHWAVSYLTRRSNSRELAKELIQQLKELEY